MKKKQVIKFSKWLLKNFDGVSNVEEMLKTYKEIERGVRGRTSKDIESNKFQQ